MMYIHNSTLYTVHGNIVQIEKFPDQEPTVKMCAIRAFLGNLKLLSCRCCVCVCVQLLQKPIIEIKCKIYEWPCAIFNLCYSHHYKNYNNYYDYLLYDYYLFFKMNRFKNRVRSRTKIHLVTQIIQTNSSNQIVGFERSYSMQVSLCQCSPKMGSVIVNFIKACDHMKN